MIGVVGGVGAGKSTAAAEFESLGCARIDADAIGYALLADPGVKDWLRRRWGERIFGPDGEVDRETLGKIVFADAIELEALNGIMQRPIGERIEAEIAHALRDDEVAGVVVDAAILFEAGWDRLCTHVLFVAAPDADRARRAAKRGMSEADWRRREKSQISLDTKEARCYGTLDNSSSVSHLREQVRLMLHRFISQADRP